MDVTETEEEREDVTVPGVQIPLLPPEEVETEKVGEVATLFDDTPLAPGVPEEEMTDEEYAARYEVGKQDTTCWNCSDNGTCPWAWDPYNTDGDCLADK